MGDMKNKMKVKAGEMEDKAHEVKGQIKGRIDQKKDDMKAE